jgi:hypothetical protein
MAAKRERSDDIESSNKRARSDVWVSYDPSDRCELIDHAREVVFIDGFFADFPEFSRVERDHPKSGRSLCTQYLFWLHPNASFSVSRATYQKFIDIRERNGELYFFKAPGFFYFSNASHLSDYSQFDKMDYDIDSCLKIGAFAATSMQVLAFYYTKILPQRLRKNVYIHKKHIQVQNFEELGSVGVLVEKLDEFFAATPEGSMGIAFVSYPEHAMALVFDSLEKRVELYEPNGIDAKYLIEERGPLQQFTMYDYLQTRARPMLLKNGIERLWGNTFKFQQKDSSCSLWASAIAICRMSGVDRDRVPTKTQDVVDITSMNRRIIWNVCRFDQFSRYVFVSFKDLDRALNACQVPEDEVTKLLTMVMKHAAYSPIPIPPDEFLNDERKDDSGGCPRPLVINLQQVDVTPYFIDYINQYCQEGPVIVRGNSLGESSAALLLIMPKAESVHLEMTEPINLSDQDSVILLQYLARGAGDSKHTITAKEAVVYGEMSTVLFLQHRVKFDRVLVAKPVSAETRARLETIADTLVDEPRSWVITLNLRNRQAITNASDLPPDSVDEIIGTGSFVGQEPHMLTDSPRSLRELMSVSTTVRLPSLDINGIVQACESARQGHTLHVAEVGASPTVDDRVHALALSHCIKKGVLSMDRFVLKLRPGANLFRNFAVAFAKEHPLVPIYMVLDPVDEQTLQAAADLGVSNFIVDQKYASDQPANLRAFLNQAKSVEHRELQKNL